MSCPVCGNPTPTPRHVYCSKQCRKWMERLRLRLYGTSWTRDRGESIPRNPDLVALSRAGGRRLLEEPEDD